MEKRLSDLMPTRRDLLKLGGLALAGSWVERVTWPLNVQAAGKANPRGTARNCILIEMGGAISQPDCWDFKETKFTPKDLNVQKVSADVFLSKTLFPRLGDFMDRISFVRSMRANELIHFVGQYHTQTGRALNTAIAREIPGFGSIIAYELDSRRRPDDTFPTYMSTYLTKARAGSIGSGFLPTRFSGLDLDPTVVFDSFGGSTEGLNQLLEERWRLLEEFAKVSDAERKSLGKAASDYKSFYNDARKLQYDPRWHAIFKTNDDEKKRYGEDEFGMGCILARNVLAADAGCHFVYIYDGDKWDHHSYIFDRSRSSNHYYTCARLDKGLTALIEDLTAKPGSQPGKTLLDETMIVCSSEFGRTPWMNPVAGRDHYRDVYTTLWVGGGVKGGRVIGKTDDESAKCLDPGWKHRQQPFMDNVVASMYSVLGIDWMKQIANTPSGRAYEYIQTAPVGGAEFISNDEIAPLFE
jgi:hypothetical protein